MQELFEDRPPECGSSSREVHEVPLCAACVVETELDGLGEETIVQRGLRRVERLDGGVTRKRYEEKEPKAGQAVGEVRMSVLCAK